MSNQDQLETSQQKKQNDHNCCGTRSDLRGCVTLGSFSGFAPDRKTQFLVDMYMDIQAKQYRALVHQRSMDAPQRFETVVVDIRETVHRVMDGDVVWDEQRIAIPFRISNWGSDSGCRNYNETLIVTGSQTMPAALFFESERNGYFTLLAKPDVAPFGNLSADGNPSAVAWVPWVVGGAVVITLGCMGIAAAADCDCHVSGSWEKKEFDVGLNC
jgi:hypothetical protein